MVDNIEELKFLEKNKGQEYDIKELYIKAKPRIGTILISRSTFNRRMQKNRKANRVVFRQMHSDGKWIYLYRHLEEKRW